METLLKKLEGNRGIFVMSDMGDVFRALKEDRRALRESYGVPCPVCVDKLPKANPSILLPQQVCKIHDFRDLRSKLLYIREKCICDNRY